MLNEIILIMICTISTVYILIVDMLTLNNVKSLYSLFSFLLDFFILYLLVQKAFIFKIRVVGTLSVQ